MANRNAKKDWLRELRKEHKELEKNGRNFEAQRETLEKRIKILEGVVSWYKKEKNVNDVDLDFEEEASERLGKMRKDLERLNNPSDIEKERCRKLKRMRTLIEYIQKYEEEKT